MAIVANPYSTYTSAKVNTVNKGDLLVMLYDAAVRFLKEADFHMQSRDFLQKSKSVENFQAIISELEATLDHHANKELAQNLTNIYNFLLREVSIANFQNDSSKLKKVIEIVNELRGAWKEANLLEKSK